MTKREYMRRYMAKRYKERRAWAIELLGGACVDCGSTTSLQFDHVDPATKNFGVSENLAGLSKKRLEAELALCALRCPECHISKSRSEGDYSHWRVAQWI